MIVPYVVSSNKICRILTGIILIFLNLNIYSDQTKIPYIKNEELKLEEQDIIRVGTSIGTRFFSKDVVNFSNVLYPAATLDEDVSNPDANLSAKLSIDYGLDNYIFPGISIGINFDYYLANIDNVSLTAYGPSNITFEYNGDLLDCHCYGIVPNIKIRTFTFIENIFNVDFSPFWDIYVYGGLRINYHSFDEGGLELKDLEDFTLGWEIGLGIEVFLSNQISLNIEYSYCTDSSKFKIIQNNTVIFNANLDLSASQTVIGINYYF